MGIVAPVKTPEPTLSESDRAKLIEEFDLALAARRRHLVVVDQPMVLISQAPRSGGTLLLRLLDGHPELHLVPWEINLGLGLKLEGDADQVWERLDDDSLDSKLLKGFSQSHRELHGDRTLYPLLVLPTFQRALWDEALSGIENPTERDYWNAYMTALLNAWLDNQNLYSRSPKAWVVLFAPRMIAAERKMANFDRIYPDGRVISVVRDPLSWFTSARRWSRRMEWTQADVAMNTWCATIEETIRRTQAKPDATLLVAYEDLVTATRGTMKLLNAFLGIRASNAAMEPTLNNLAIHANSSFESRSTRVSAAPLQRHESELKKGEADYVRKRAWPLYEEALALASRPES
jgi:hypothetical protein